MRHLSDLDPKFGFMVSRPLPWVVVFLAMSCAAGDEEKSTVGLFPAGLESYSVQMHIHGHSHHNGDRRPGSMQWHSHFAAANRLSVLWWSDHSEMFDLSSPLRLNFDREWSSRKASERELRQAVHLEGRRLSLDLVKAPPEDVAWIEAEGRSVSGRRRLVARSPAEAEMFSESLYAVRGPRGTPKGFLLPRPVSSGATLSVELRAGQVTPDVRIELEVGLSWHYRGVRRRHLLRYRLAPESTPPGLTLADASTALITVPVPSTRTRVSLDLERDASVLRDGTDNTLTSLEVRLASRRGAESFLEIFGIELSSREPEPDHQLAQIRRFASTYGAEYGHQQHVGVEFLTEGNGYVHLNAFLPEGALTGRLASGDEKTWHDPAEFVRRVHRLGGVTSFNHLFGTGASRGKPRQEERRSRVRALQLLQNNAYGADVLEVGYTSRGGVGLEYHLRTWDRLTARGLYLYGNGVSDAHGGVWGPRMKPNRFATWIWSEGPAADQLIAGIKRGRMVFGDPFSYSGKLYFWIGDAGMGDRTRVRDHEQVLRVAVDGHFDPSRHRLYMVQALIRPATKRVLYLTRSPEAGYRRQVSAAEPFGVDVSRPCFVRLELYGSEGEPLAFSNPIVFERRK